MIKNNITFYSKILAAILPTKSCKFNSECIKYRNLLKNLINTGFYCKINCKFGIFTVMSCINNTIMCIQNHVKLCVIFTVIINFRIPA